MQVEQGVLVRGEKGEQGTAVSAPEFDDPLWASLDARAEIRISKRVAGEQKK